MTMTLQLNEIIEKIKQMNENLNIDKIKAFNITPSITFYNGENYKIADSSERGLAELTENEGNIALWLDGEYLKFDNSNSYYILPVCYLKWVAGRQTAQFVYELFFQTENPIEELKVNDKNCVLSPLPDYRIWYSERDQSRLVEACNSQAKMNLKDVNWAALENIMLWSVDYMKDYIRLLTASFLELTKVPII